MVCLIYAQYLWTLSILLACGRCTRLEAPYASHLLFYMTIILAVRQSNSNNMNRNNRHFQACNPLKLILLPLSSQIHNFSQYSIWALVFHFRILQPFECNQLTPQISADTKLGVLPKLTWGSREVSLFRIWVELGGYDWHFKSFSSPERISYDARSMVRGLGAQPRLLRVSRKPAYDSFTALTALRFGHNHEFATRSRFFTVQESSPTLSFTHEPSMMVAVAVYHAMYLQPKKPIRGVCCWLFNTRSKKLLINIRCRS